MKTTSDIISAIGAPRIKNAFGVGDRVLQLYARQGVMPASWFDFCEKATGKKLPRHLFSFKVAPK